MRVLACAVCLVVAASSAAQEGRYLVRGPQLPVSSIANGHVQSVSPHSPGEVLVQVTTARVPVGSAGSYGAMDRWQGELPSGFTLPRELRSELRPELDAYDAATRVLKWVARRLRIDDGDGPQDAVAVLTRRGGRCSGIANATAALLLATGFEAKTVSGLLVTEQGLVPHRWVVCRLPEVGWVATDPTLGLWVVSPRHLAFPDTVDALPDVDVLQADDPGLDRLPRWRGRPVRPNLGASLVCRLIGDGTPERAMAVLYGRGGEVRRTLLEPEGRFEGLLPGRWRLVVVSDGVVLEERDLRLAPSQAHSFAVPRSRPAAVEEVGS